MNTSANIEVVSLSKNKNLIPLHLQDCPNEKWESKGSYQLSNWGRIKVDGQIIHEEFKPITEYLEGYFVSNHGRVKKNRRGELIYSLSENSVGYLKCNIAGKQNAVHILVAKYFLGHEPNGYKEVVDHKDNVRHNNCYLNLQTITNRENTSKDRKAKWSEFTGVYFRERNQRWVSKIMVNKKYITLGEFIHEENANIAYESALKIVEELI